MRATLLALAVLLPAVSHAATDRSVDRWGVEEGLRNDVLTSIIQTRDGYLWIGSWAGLVRFDGVRFTNVADDLPNVHARVLVEDPDGSIWVGTSGGGVFRWRPGRIDSYDVAHGLAGDDVNAMIQDPQGRIWVGTQRTVRTPVRRVHERSLYAFGAADARRELVDRHRRARPLPMGRPPHAELQPRRRALRYHGRRAVRGS